MNEREEERGRKIASVHPISTNIDRASIPKEGVWATLFASAKVAEAFIFRNKRALTESLEV
jgi:hypothetical protein